MKRRIALFIAGLSILNGGQAQENALTFPNDDECDAVRIDIQEHITPQQLSGLNETYSNGFMYTIFRYVVGRDSILLDLKKQYGETQLTKSLDGVKSKLNNDQVEYWSEYVSYKDRARAENRLEVLSDNDLSKQMELKLRLCTAAAVYKADDFGDIDFSRMTKVASRSGRFGYFDISLENCTIGASVGTQNRYSEPDRWEGSQFVVVDARFKNIDNEARLPFEGSLIIITSDGEELRYDNTESIMSGGYGIYFKSVNPLVNMPTKIVYRIPTDIEGDVLWEPGRNDNNKRLWCAFVSAK